MAHLTYLELTLMPDGWIVGILGDGQAKRPDIVEYDVAEDQWYTLRENAATCTNKCLIMPRPLNTFWPFK